MNTAPVKANSAEKVMPTVRNGRLSSHTNGRQQGRDRQWPAQHEQQAPHAEREQGLHDGSPGGTLPLRVHVAALPSRIQPVCDETPDPPTKRVPTNGGHLPR